MAALLIDVVLLQRVHKVLCREHGWVVPDFQCEGFLVKIVNTGHLVSHGGRPQSHILRCLYLLKARVTCVGALDWCSIACYVVVVCHGRSVVKSVKVPVVEVV